ncbi:hypothetical protein PRUPE_4G263200 [Prunus persica]|uniref:Uncharacterized protein n=1 Tax=Prunus persica TaxID=3760 RepID=A0A251PRC0_PRUPE|nr:hypothetical protein PRUPE_4G263200 [Prunus persica]
MYFNKDTSNNNLKQGLLHPAHILGKKREPPPYQQVFWLLFFSSNVFLRPKLGFQSYEKIVRLQREGSQ